MEKLPDDYILAESVFDFVDVNPYVYEEGYSPYYGMSFYLWDNDACDYIEYVVDEDLQDYELEKAIKNRECYVPKKAKRKVGVRQSESSTINSDD